MLRLWEALWSRHPSPQLHIFCAAALLERHRRTIMDRNLDFDGLLKCALNLDTLKPLKTLLVRHGCSILDGNLDFDGFSKCAFCLVSRA